MRGQLGFSGRTVLRTGLIALGAGAPAACRSAEVDPPALEVVEVASPAPEGSAQPNLSQAPDGSALLTWIAYTPGEGHRVEFSRLVGSSWSSPRTIAANADLFVNWADFPSLLELPSGRLVAHYLQRETGIASAYHYGIRVVQSSDGGMTWSDPVIPHRSGVTSEYGFVSLLPNGDDSVRMIWLDGRKYSERYGASEEMSLRSATISADGQLGAEQEIDGRVCDCCPTSVAVTTSGAAAVFRDRSDDEIRDISVTRLIDGRWSEGRPVRRDGWRINACPVNGPSISARGDRAVVGWFTMGGDTAAVRVAFSGDGAATFEEPVRVDDGDPIGRVAVSLSSSGQALVVWLERVSRSEASVRYRVVDRAGRMSESRSLATTTAASASGFPRIAAAGDDFLIAWTDVRQPGGVRTAILRAPAPS